MKKSLFLFLSLFFVIQSWAQQTLVIANGTTISETLPVYGYWMDANQHNQFIYPASLVDSLNGALITKLTFHGDVLSNPFWGSPSCVVSLGSTIDSNFTSATHNTTPLTPVYSGFLDVINGVMEFVFSTPYVFPGGNLLIDIVTTTTGDYETYEFYGVTANNSGISQLENDTPILEQFLPKATFEYVIGTPIVITAPPTSIMAETAILNGSFYNITSTNYGFEYMETTSTDWTNAISVLATSNPMSESISTLSPNTSYKYRAYAHDGISNIYGNVVNFNTIPVPDTLPYFCNFEDTIQNGTWILQNGSEPNQWFIGAPGSNGVAGNGLYISNDNGLTASFDSTAASTVMATKYIQFNDAAEFALSFDWMAMGGYWEGYVMAYLVPTSFTLTPGTMIPYSYSITPELMGYSNWQHLSILLGAQYSNSVQKLVFMWYNESYGIGTNPPGLIDNISIVPLTCPSPTNLSVSMISTNTAQLTWSHATQSPEYIVEYQLQGDTIWNALSVLDTTALLTQLLPSSDYVAKVKAVCTPGDSSFISNLVYFTTLCLPSLPPTTPEPFINMLPSSCWAIKSGVLPATGNASLTDQGWGWYLRYTLPTSTAAVNMYSDNCQYWLITPSYDLGNGSSQYQLDFDLARTAYDSPSIGNLNLSPNARFVVLISTDNGQTWNSNGILQEWNNTSGTPFSAINNTLQTQSIPLFDSVAMAPYSGVVRFAFYAYEYDDNYIFDNDIHIDNFQILPFNSCIKPTALVASNITLNSLDLSWTENGSATEWQIEYGPTGFTHGTGTYLAATTTTLNISGLTAVTTYDFYVRAICGIGDTSYWSSMISASTQCPPFTLPFTEGFNAQTVPTCWDQTISGSMGTNVWSIYDLSEIGFNGNGMITEMMMGNGISRLISPAIDFTGVPYANLTFEQFYLDEDGITTLKIQTSTDLINWVDQPYTYSQSGGLVGPETANVLLSLTGGVNYVAWVIEGDHEYIGWAIDDVSITATTITCPSPTNLQVSTITGSSATATWTPGGSETSWQVDYKLSSATNWTTANTSSPTFTMTGLQGNSTYVVRVKAICTGDESPFTPTFTFSTVGIDENQWSHYVTLFPNPATSVIELKIKSDQLHIKECKVFDMYGKLMKVVPIQSEITTLDVKEFAAGVYFMRMESEQGAISKKFVKK